MVGKVSLVCGASVTFWAVKLHDIFVLAMTHYPQPNPTNRATRIHLGSEGVALLKSEGGERTKAKLQTVSVTGGLLRVAKALEEGDFVEVAFQTLNGPVHGMAEMLRPKTQSAEGALQPFKFIALEDQDHKTLRFAVDSTTEREFLLGPNRFASR